MRSLTAVGLHFLCTVFIAAHVQSHAMGGNPQSQPTWQTAPAGMPCPAISYSCCVVPCPVYQCYPVCPPIVCPNPCYTMMWPCPAVVCVPFQSPGAKSSDNQKPVKPKDENPPMPGLDDEDTTPTPKPTPEADGGNAGGSASQGSPPPLNPTQVAYKVKAIRDLLGVEFNYTPLRKGFKCELMQVDPKPVEDVFGKKDWVPAGPAAELNADNWKDVTDAIVKAMNDPEQHQLPQSPIVALRVTIPAENGSPAVQYVILMIFSQKKMQLYRNVKQNVKLLGTHAIQDNGKWAATLNALGAAPTPKTSPSP